MECRLIVEGPLPFNSWRINSKDKLARWRAHSLSWAGRVTMINSVINSLPQYTESPPFFCLMPKATTNELDSMTKKFNPKKGACIRICNGSNARFWLDPSIPGNPNLTATGRRRGNINHELRVSDSLFNHRKRRNSDVLAHLVDSRLSR